MLINSIKSIRIRKMRRKIGFNYKGKEIILEAREMKGLNKMLGLIFYKEILLFDFSKLTKMRIHSLFCPRFLAIWLDGENRVVDLRIVEPWNFSVSSRKTFSKLVEIPINSRYSSLVEKLVPF